MLIHRFWVRGLSCCLIWTFGCSLLLGAEAGFIEDFSSGLGGWEGTPPTVQDSGGPAGDGDAFLLIESRGGNGPGSRLASFNNADQWVGDFAAAGIQSVDMDIINFETSPSTVSMRLALFGPNSTGNRWTSIDPIMVANDGLWQRISFPIGSEVITRAAGASDYDSMLQNVVRVMVRHDPGTPSGTGAPVTGAIGIDNITLVGGTPSLGDFNDDGVVDVLDVDLLLGEVKSGSNAPEFDLTGDGVVDTSDIDYIITSPQELNTYIGDANLDGEFNSGDLVQTLGAGQYEDSVSMNSTWATGDWNGDAEYSTDDLIFALQGGGYETGPRGAEQAVAVPEPASAWLSLVALLSLGKLRQRHR